MTITRSIILDEGTMRSIETEKRTIEFMIRYYCRKIHKETSLCRDCADLIAYAHRRLDACRYGNEKTSCRKCPTHCYSPENRESVRRIMRYVGPRMVYLKPLKFAKHIFYR